MQEEEKMKEFGSFERVRARERGLLNDLQEALFASREEMNARAGSREGLSSQEAQLYLSYFGAQTAKIRYQHDLLKKLDIGVRRKRTEMTFAINRRKIMDRLKEKHIEAEDQEARRTESFLIDEIAGARFAARSRGSEPSAQRSAN